MSDSPLNGHKTPIQASYNPLEELNPFSSAIPSYNYPRREFQRNYVFVDEHNRHKRLKVVRACEGCRKRKIKCDAATTNTWPCSACIRLQVDCLRPNGNDNAIESCGYDPTALSNAYFRRMPCQQGMARDYFESSQPSYSSQSQLSVVEIADAHHKLPFDTPYAPQPNMTSQPSSRVMECICCAQYPCYNVPSEPPLKPQGFQRPSAQQQQQSQVGLQGCQQLLRRRQADSAFEESLVALAASHTAEQRDLSDLLGALKVDETGSAPYLKHIASYTGEETPVVEYEDDIDNLLPPMPSAAGLKIKIPSSIMPGDEIANRYIDLYFIHIRPYVPALSQVQFEQQWRTSRNSISPLILEAMFAMGAGISEASGERHRWLALVSRHADSFMDTPRLSTLQALLMILKAREASPKRGYFYRSWMTVVQCVQMAKDLGLNEHLDNHRLRRPCHASLEECQLRTRLWQLVFVCEVMVGTPQGRHDLGVDINTVDFSTPRRTPGGDEREHQTSRRFTYFARVVRNVGKLSNVYLKLMKSSRLKEWGIEPEVQQLDGDYALFMAELPQDLDISYPADGSPPQLSSAFLGNLHSYYHLSLILFHRPQLSFLDRSANDGQWKHHMMRCYRSAKSLCRIQEAIIGAFGLVGLQCMQRGYSFTIYAGLSCMALHLVAMVSADPDLNTDSREYFTRHMRIMEMVMGVWAMPDLSKQIDALREAFSADVLKPFVLRPTFPYARPRTGAQAGATGGRPPAATRLKPRDVNVKSCSEGGPTAESWTECSSKTNDMMTTLSGWMMVPPSSPANVSTLTSYLAPDDAPTWDSGPMLDYSWSKTFGAFNLTSTAADSDNITALPASSSRLPEGPAPESMHNTCSIASGSQQVPRQTHCAAAQPGAATTTATWPDFAACVDQGSFKAPWVEGDFGCMSTGQF